MNINWWRMVILPTYLIETKRYSSAIRRQPREWEAPHAMKAPKGWSGMWGPV